MSAIAPGKPGPLQAYACPGHPAGHVEKATVDYTIPVEPGLCSAQLRGPGGTWRVCHADLEANGPVWRPDHLAQICKPCTDRILGRAAALAAGLRNQAERRR